MTTTPLPDHIHRPHLRPIQPIPVQKDGRNFVALRDPQQLQPQTIVVPPNTLQVLQSFRGELTLEQIADRFRTELAQLVALAQGLDQLGLLWGPTLEKLEAEALKRIEAEGALPGHATASLGQNSADAAQTLASYLDQTEDPELNAVSRGIVAPHLDYERGWPNYAAAYHGVRAGPKPDRVVILGTNHFGMGEGVVMTEFGFKSPLGRSPADSTIVENVVGQFGRRILRDQLDFVAEHSVDLHVPWVQHCFGTVPIVAALIPDPFSPPDAEDGDRVDGPEFIDVLRRALAEAGGASFVISSADLSHVGPQFGEPRPVDDQRRFDVERHDRDMMGKYLTGEIEGFLEAMQWNRNPTRWCSIGNMAAALQLVEPESLELIDYRQAVDEKGQCLVSSAAIALL